MFGLALAKAMQIYGISIAISMLVAVLIKILVALTGRIKRPVAETMINRTLDVPPIAVSAISEEIVAALSAAISAVTGPHRILHIAESNRSWSSQGRSAQHSHQPRH